MKKAFVFSAIAAPLLAFALILPSHAADSTNPTTCKDGTTSSATGKGACSGHGGVQKAPTSTGAAATSTSEPAAPATSGGATTCKDGTTSSATGKGACSGHGGVQKATIAKSAGAAPTTVTPAAATAAAPAAKSPPVTTKSAPTAATGNTDPTGATAKCKDGTYSKSQHRSGTCSSHGGVAEWLTTTQ
jgi:hypothetical protein